MGPSVAVSWPFLFLLISYSWFKIGTGVMTVGANAAATELFPASLRATMIGCQSITAAVFSMLAQILIAALIGPLGGLSNVIRYFALLGIPSAILFGMFIDETAGVPLEIASREEEWEQAQSSSDREATGSRRAANR
jgi:MFS family permease